MDMSKLSESDLNAIAKGDLRMMSAAGLEALAGSQPQEGGIMQDIAQGAGNLAAGAVRGAGSIGATLLTPYDLAMGNTQSIGNPERRLRMDEGLQSMGADPESLLYQIPKIATEVAGTLGTGGLLAQGATRAGMSPAVASALNTWGMGKGNVALRAAAGTGTGLAAGTAINPEHALMSAGIGGGLAVALPPVIGAATRGASSVRQAFYPTPGSVAVRAAADKSDDVIRALENTASDVQGVNLTAGQAGVGANSAEFAALQKMISQDRAPSRFYGDLGIEGQQFEAHKAAVRGFGGTADELKRAVDARTATSGVNYEAAFDQSIQRDPVLRALWKDPYFKAEVGEARKLFKASNLKRARDGLPPRDSRTEFLHFVKEGLDARIQGATNPLAPAISQSTKSAVMNVKSDLVKWLGKNTAYDDARLAHIEMSKPINQMRVGQDLERSLVSPLETERAASFAGKIRSAETKISKSTGRPQIDDLTPEQIKTVKAIQADFTRNVNYEKLAQVGGGESLNRRIGAPVVPPTGWFVPLVSATRSWANKRLGTGYEQGLEKLAPHMENPKVVAELMRNATPKQRELINTYLEKSMSASTIAVMQGLLSQSQPQQPQGLLGR